MRFRNHTSLDSMALEVLVREGFKRAGVSSVGYTVWVVNAINSRGAYTGEAECGAPWLKVRVPLHNGLDKKVLGFDSFVFSQVLQHEIDHTRGLDHVDMVESEDIDCEWANGFVVERIE